MSARSDMARQQDSSPAHDARQLTDTGREARILLHRMVSSLRVTRQGKPVLTK